VCGRGKKSTALAQALGRSRGGFSTKIHAVVDALGNPLDFRLTGGQAADITQAEALLPEAPVEAVVADKGYDADAFLSAVTARGAQAVIPPRKTRVVQRDYDRHRYKERHLIECFFGKIKHYRRIFSRFEKTATNYLSFLHLVAALVWLR
jgi:transposase